MINDNKIKTHQGRNIRFFRNAKEMKQEDFADRIGVTQPAVVKIEKQSVVEPSILLKCAEVLGVSVDMLKQFDTETMFDNFTYNIEKIQNTHGVFSVSKDSSIPTNNHYPIEKLMELHRENVELYERLLQSEKEKNAYLEKMLSEKKD